jgi:GT2 family glycosyltransferase
MSEQPVIVSRNSGNGQTPTPKPPAEHPLPLLGTGLVSILMPCCGMVEYTKLCLPALLRYTRPPFELLLLDVGSLDGTADYLAGIAAALPNVRVEVLRAGSDLDVPGVCSDALAAARGDAVVLLNNDTIVTDGWLHQLLALGSMSPAVGLVGPMSNYAAPPQLVETVPYRIGPRRHVRARGGPEWLVDTEAVHAFARQLREEQRGKWLEAERLGGFCLLVKREVLKRIGPLESGLGLGLFDTDVLSLKAKGAGFTLAVCRDLFVHHFGTRTFAHGAANPPPPVPERRHASTVT